MASDEDDRDIGPAGELPLQFEPAEARESDIEHEAAGNRGARPRHEICCGYEGFDPPALCTINSPSDSRTDTSSSTTKTTDSTVGVVTTSAARPALDKFVALKLTL
jgi:hypothetical protein